MQISRIIFILLLTGTFFFCAGCIQDFSSPGTVSPDYGSAVIIDPARLVLTPSDVPQGFTLAESRTKNPSDMSRLALDLGWQGGHVVRYIRPAQVGTGAFEIIHTIAIYPVQTMPDVIEYSVQQSRLDSDFSYSDIAVQGLGENARAFSGKAGTQMAVKSTGNNPLNNGLENPAAGTGVKTDFSIVIFSKGNSFEVVKIMGTAPDSGLLLNLSKTAYAKIS